MPKVKREKICYLCEKGEGEHLSFMVCTQCLRHYCSRHGDLQVDLCTNCLERGEEA